MTITYEFDGTLYLNITNKCTNSCDFCVRTTNDGYYSEASLWLEHEPSEGEIKASIESRDLSAYKEIVFCGYGEPTCRFDLMIKIGRYIRERSSVPIRLNTNGHACLIMGEDVTPRLSGIFDVVSVSLNSASAKDYAKLCHPEYGEEAYKALIDFAHDAKRYVPRVFLSVVRTTIPDADIEKCRTIAEENGVELRVRELV